MEGIEAANTKDVSDLENDLQQNCAVPPSKPIGEGRRVDRDSCRSHHVGERASVVERADFDVEPARAESR